jgi:hypothetical protein
MTATSDADAYRATADDLVALAKRIEFDERHAGELRRIAARVQLKADCAAHPDSKAWFFLMSAKQGCGALAQAPVVRMLATRMLGVDLGDQPVIVAESPDLAGAVGHAHCGLSMCLRRVSHIDMGDSTATARIASMTVSSSVSVAASSRAFNMIMSRSMPAMTGGTGHSPAA